MSDKVTARTVQLTKEDIEELQKDPKNVVYDVKFTENVEYTPMEKVKHMIGVIRGLCAAIRESNPTWKDDRVRNEVRKRSKAADDMAARTHPKLFLMVTKKTMTDEEARMLSFMINLHEQCEAGEMTKEEAGTAVLVEMMQKEMAGKK